MKKLTFLLLLLLTGSGLFYAPAQTRGVNAAGDEFCESQYDPQIILLNLMADREECQREIDSLFCLDDSLQKMASTPEKEICLNGINSDLQIAAVNLILIERLINEVAESICQDSIFFEPICIDLNETKLLLKRDCENIPDEPMAPDKIYNCPGTKIPSVKTNCWITWSEPDSDPSEKILIYPNPVASDLKIHFPGSGQLFIYDLTGKEVFNSNINGEISLSLANFNRGIYLVKLIAAGQEVRQKIFKE